MIIKVFVKRSLKPVKRGEVTTPPLLDRENPNGYPMVPGAAISAGQSQHLMSED
jgi:hypothetical protein